MNLCYTVAFDPPGCGICHHMARMLGGAMSRTYFSGDTNIFRNSADPMFLIKREGINEIEINIPDGEGLMEAEVARRRLGLGDIGGLGLSDDSGKDGWSKAKSEGLLTYAMSWKHSARLGLDVDGYDSVLFLDADCLPLRNLDHLLAGQDWDILYQEEPGRSIQDEVFSGYLSPEETTRLDGINSGTWAVRAEVYHAVMERWAAIEGKIPPRRTRWTEQSAWNRLILDCRLGKLPWTAKRFEAHEILFPLHLKEDGLWRDYKHGAILHCMGLPPQEKIEFMFGMYMQTFFYDPGGTMLGMLDM